MIPRKNIGSVDGSVGRAYDKERGLQSCGVARPTGVYSSQMLNFAGDILDPLIRRFNK